jgi:hypothetical protein
MGGWVAKRVFLPRVVLVDSRERQVQVFPGWIALGEPQRLHWSDQGMDLASRQAVESGRNRNRGLSSTFTDQQLQAYLDESLPAAVMSALEKELRGDQSLRDRLVQVSGMREAGVHSLGEIWRKNRLSCPGRQQLGSFILGAMDEQTADYIQFHLEVVGCRVCQANLEDLKTQNSEQAEAKQDRRRRYFQTSVGQLSQHRPQ